MIYISSWHSQDIGIIMQSGHMCQFWLPAKSSTNSLMLIQSHAYAFSATANGDARSAFVCFHTFCQGMCKIGIITTFLAKTTIIFI